MVKELIEDKIYLESHLLCYIETGALAFKTDYKEFKVHAGEFVVLHKAQTASFYKIGNEQNEYRSYLVFFTDDFLVNFIESVKVLPEKLEESVCLSVNKGNERIQTMFSSVDHYFEEQSEFDGPILSLKLRELFFEIANINKHMLLQIFQAKQQVRCNIYKVMEENFSKPVSVADLAYLSGRSLASFKRDFKKMSERSPAEWMKNRRLEEAEKLLLTSDLSITDICYQLGFENTAHFSKIFKKKFLKTPSDVRKTI
ncbi:hypothetical protein NBRC110019_08410 [Neptunitalea chrysea]|uniref:HTH araC/xylS-type domain-containing protein n=1 Tax=Neptunitalea chrysea TaxID=1647581 RepID=A0A9W6EUV9_9FLAO|nr:hypothetical protein NBRC110019_08410 [Neptunitalea chrysea]